MQVTEVQKLGRPPLPHEFFYSAVLCKLYSIQWSQWYTKFEFSRPHIQFIWKFLLVFITIGQKCKTFRFGQ